ncbi:MAG: alpha/beta hydrolase, partial [Actinobacteria bacterium]|nr:alpha/beta hydrolase [Actinomycetota bacterium]
MTHSELTPTSHGDALSAWHYRAGSESWTMPAGRPCVVMAHGFGATKDAGLTPFAERLAAAGDTIA